MSKTCKKCRRSYPTHQDVWGICSECTEKEKSEFKDKVKVKHG